jgi:hypothetical protein
MLRRCPPREASVLQSGNLIEHARSPMRRLGTWLALHRAVVRSRGRIHRDGDIDGGRHADMAGMRQVR